MAGSLCGLLARGLSEQILDFIYIDSCSLARLQTTAQEVRRHCATKIEQLRWRRVLHIDLTAEEVDFPFQDITANVLEVKISNGLADRCEELQIILEQCTNLQHIHLQLVPDPGWLIADWVENILRDDELLAIAEAEKITQNDSVSLLYAKLWRRYQQQQRSKYYHLDGCLESILSALCEDLWCPSLSSVSVFELMTLADFGDHLESQLFGLSRRHPPEKRGLLRGDIGDLDVVFMNEDGVSSEAQWRKVSAFSGFLYVGRPDQPNRWGFAHALADANAQDRARPFASYYYAGGEGQRRGMCQCSVQVAGIFPKFACLVGTEFAYRFVQSNPKHGQSMAWEEARLFYESVGEDAEDMPRLRELAGNLEGHDDEDSEFGSDFSDFNEDEVAARGHVVCVSTGCGHGIRAPRFFLPEFAGDDDEAQLAVRNSELEQLSPAQPGVAAQTWQELAGIAGGQPDIKWLGRVVHGPWGASPSRRYWNDFRIIHAGEKTNLEHEGHRNRFGEKCMKYGSIDICIRTLSQWLPGHKVGYHGVLDIFVEARCVRSFNHYWPKLAFFLEAQNYSKWVQPHTRSCRQHVANSILARFSSMDIRDTGVREVIRKCRETLLAEPTIEGGICDLAGGLTVWENLFGNYRYRGREALQAFDWMLQHGPVINEGRGGEDEAGVIRQHWDRCGGLGEESLGIFVQRCKDMRAFSPEALELLWCLAWWKVKRGASWGLKSLAEQLQNSLFPRSATIQDYPRLMFWKCKCLQHGCSKQLARGQLA